MSQKESKIKDLKVTMPTIFDDKRDYVEKLQELIETEAQINRLSIESIAEKDVEFTFEEILDIYCRMKLRVPKTNQQFIREQAVLKVVIPIFNHEGGIQREYVGAGTIKKVLIRANDPFLTVIFELNVVIPQDKGKRQKIPERNVNYDDQLAFRVCYDDTMIESHKFQVRKNLEVEKDKNVKCIIK